jgi:ankyrin repeat protein
MVAGCATSVRVISRFAIALSRPEKYFSDRKQLALCHAIEQNSLKSVSKLVADGSNVNAVGNEGMTPLHWAIYKQKYEAFSLLLELGAKPDLVVVWYEDIKVERWASAMEIAAMLEAPRYLRRLLDAGASADMKITPLGATPLFIAIRNRRLQNVDILLGAGADINFRSNRLDETPLHSAMMDNNFFGALYLIRAGALVNIPARRSGMTAMDVFAGRGPPRDPSDEENRAAYFEIMALQAAGNLPMGKR